MSIKKGQNDSLSPFQITKLISCKILSEINVGDSRSAKSAILSHLEALKLDFYEFLHFLNVEIYQINKIQSL